MGRSEVHTNLLETLHGREREKETTWVITTYVYEDNIKMDVKKLRCEDVDWIHLAQDTVSCEGSNNLRLHDV